MKKILLLMLFASIQCFAARAFNGTSQGILGSNCCFTEPNGGTTVSLAAWAYVSATGSYSTIAEYKNDQFPGFYAQGLAVDAGGHFRAYIYNGGTGVAILSGVLTTNVWTHVALTWDVTSGLLRLYVNGTQVNTGSPGIATASFVAPLGVGAGYNGGCCDTFLQGSVAEVATWNVLLTPTEISALAHGSPASLVHPSKAGGNDLLQYWPMHGLGTTEPNFTNVVSNNQAGGLQAAPSQAAHCPCGMPTGEGH